MVMTEVAGRCVVERVGVCAEDVCMCLVGVCQYASVCVCVCAGIEGGACVYPDLGVLLSSVMKYGVPPVGKCTRLRTSV